MARALIAVEVEYDPRITDAESVAGAVDALLETALSTPGILDEYGDPTLGETQVIMEPADQHGRTWDLPCHERCLVCGQPDSFGDCTHEPLTDEQVVELGGVLPKTAEG